MFKLNQVVEAIALVFEPGSAKPSSEMRTRLKRLLETDRGLGRNKRSADPECANFAFHSMDMPGRGVENWFSHYEAFALVTGLRLMRHGWPQGFVVAVLRRVRPELEKHHARILRQAPAILLDEQLIRRRAKPGDFVVGNTDPVFLAICTTNRDVRSGSIPVALCKGQPQLMAFILSHGSGQTFMVDELGDSAHALLSALAKTRPRKRGRGRD
jgi:hypothetical protein